MARFAKITKESYNIVKYTLNKKRKDMQKKLRCIIIALGIYCSCVSATGFAQPLTKQSFHNIFTVAGYSSALCAVMGAAILGLSKEPSENLNYITMGASIGFIGGVALGTFMNISTSVETTTLEQKYQGPGANDYSSIWPQGVRLNFKFAL
jgi:hypothetical protein